jgi:glycosyltransferase involved in cell wall biosynthesis
MIKILIATGLYPPESGGPATYTRLLEERLPALGFEVRVLPFNKVRYLPKLLRHIAYFGACVAAARGADIIYAQDTVSVGLPAALAAIVLGKKFVVRVPGDYSWEQARQRFGVVDELDAFQTKKYGYAVTCLRVVQQFVVRRARLVIVPSEYMKRLVSGWGSTKERIHVVYSSIDFAVSCEPPRDRPKGFLVVTVARPVPWKGLEGLARVVAREGSWHVKIVHDIPRTQALGWVSAADVFVLNSSYEGLSHALIEAMWLGTPIVATQVGGNPELVQDGVEGLLIPSGNDEALYKALKKIEGDTQSAHVRAEAAKTKAKQFSIDATITEIAGLLKTL